MNDLSALTFTELQELGREVQQAIDALAQKQIDSAKVEIQRIAKAAGIDLKAMVAAQAKPSRSAKYANPNDQRQQWSGHGKRPRWFTEWTESGKSADELLVQRN